MCRKVFASKSVLAILRLAFLKKYIDFPSTVLFDLSDPKSSHVAIVPHFFFFLFSSAVSVVARSVAVSVTVEIRFPHKRVKSRRKRLRTPRRNGPGSRKITLSSVRGWASVRALLARICVARARIGQKIEGARKRDARTGERKDAPGFSTVIERGPCSLRSAKERV